jgi:hypothetical protein
VVLVPLTALIWTQLVPEALVGQATLQLPPVTVATTVTSAPVFTVPLIVPVVDALDRRLIESHCADIVVVGTGVGLGVGVGEANAVKRLVTA